MPTVLTRFFCSLAHPLGSGALGICPFSPFEARGLTSPTPSHHFRRILMTSQPHDDISNYVSYVTTVVVVRVTSVVLVSVSWHREGGCHVTSYDIRLLWDELTVCRGRVVHSLRCAAEPVTGVEGNMHTTYIITYSLVMRQTTDYPAHDVWPVFRNARH